MAGLNRHCKLHPPGTSGLRDYLPLTPLSRSKQRNFRPRTEATPQLAAQVVLDIARRSTYAAAGINTVAVVSKGNMATNLLLWYSSLGALMSSLGTWIVYLTGVLYLRLKTVTPEPEARMLHGVDVTRSRFLSRAQVIAAVDFAAAAHAGQVRLTGDAYVVHVIKTAVIVEGLLANSARSFTLGERAEMAVIVALLHDVLDDTEVTPAELEAGFGKEVAGMVKKVSRLSSLNQLLRRNRRHREERAGEDPAALARDEEEKNSLHNMLLLMVDEPLVIVVKLADRLHNMRTAYALAPNKRCAVATETLEVWCTLAERLGMFAIKSELEDLCFAVLHPECYRKLHAARNELWKRNVVSPSVAEEADRVLDSYDGDTGNKESSEYVRGPESASTAIASTSYASEGTPQQRTGSKRIMRQHFPTGQSATGLSSPSHDSGAQRPPAQEPPAKPAEQARERWQQARAQQQLKLRQQALSRRQRQPPTRYWQHPGIITNQQQREAKQEQREMRKLLKKVLRFDDTTYKLGGRRLPAKLPTDLAGLQDCTERLIYEIDIESVATGLDVHVEGRLKSLYSVWKKMMRKGASLAEIYDARALRVVVDDQEGAKTQEAIEVCYSLLGTVQHLWRKVPTEDDDDYIANPKPSGYQSLHTAVIGPGGSPLEVQIRTSSMHEVAEYGRAAHWTYKENTPLLPGPSEPGILKPGQPVMRVQGRKLNLGAVLDWDPETRRCMVVVQVGSRPNPGSAISQAEVDTLLKAAEDYGWSRQGDGNWSYYLELYAFYKDRKFHNTDVYKARGKATLVPLFTEQDMEEAQRSQPAETGQQQRSRQLAESGNPRHMDQKIRLLREVLEWGEGVEEGMAAAQAQPPQPTVTSVVAEALREPVPAEREAEGNIIVLLFPEGEFKEVPKGTTAANIIQEKGICKPEERMPAGDQVVNVNNLLVPEDTQLKNGDFVIRSRDLLQI